MGIIDITLGGMDDYYDGLDWYARYAWIVWVCVVAVLLIIKAFVWYFIWKRVQARKRARQQAGIVYGGQVHVGGPTGMYPGAQPPQYGTQAPQYGIQPPQYGGQPSEFKGQDAGGWIHAPPTTGYPPPQLSSNSAPAPTH